MKVPRAEGACSIRAEALASARDRFLQWGYSGTSISMIAEDLDVSKAALYYHFPDKEALFLAVFDEYLRGVAADLLALAPLFEAATGAVSGRRKAFESLAAVFLSRGSASVKMDRLAFQESPRLGEAGRASLGQRYHRDLVGPLEGYFGLAEKAGWIRPAQEGDPARVWIFMGLLSAFFAPGHKASEDLEKKLGSIESEASAFARTLLEGIGS